MWVFFAPPRNSEFRGKVVRTPLVRPSDTPLPKGGQKCTCLNVFMTSDALVILKQWDSFWFWGAKRGANLLLLSRFRKLQKHFITWIWSKSKQYFICSKPPSSRLLKRSWYLKTKYLIVPWKLVVNYKTKQIIEQH